MRLGCEGLARGIEDATQFEGNLQLKDVRDKDLDEKSRDLEGRDKDLEGNFGNLLTNARSLQQYGTLESHDKKFEEQTGEGIHQVDKCQISTAMTKKNVGGNLEYPRVEEAQGTKKEVIDFMSKKNLKSRHRKAKHNKFVDCGTKASRLLRQGPLKRRKRSSSRPQGEEVHSFSSIGDSEIRHCNKKILTQIEGKAARKMVEIGKELGVSFRGKDEELMVAMKEMEMRDR